MTSLDFGQPIRGVIQIAFIVEDINKSMPIYANQLNIGPWYLFEDFKFSWIKHRGQAVDLKIDLCLGFNGHMMFELIEQKNDVESVYSEVRRERGYGYHHSAISAPSDEYDRVVDAYKSAGYDLALDAAVDVGGRAAYMDARHELGGFIEVIEMNEDVERLFTTLYRESVGWDGANPVRRLT